MIGDRELISHISSITSDLLGATYPLTWAAMEPSQLRTHSSNAVPAAALPIESRILLASLLAPDSGALTLSRAAIGPTALGFITKPRVSAGSASSPRKSPRVVA